MQVTQTALITGATGGLGAHLCREFAQHGYNLVITARDPEKLRRLANWLRESCRVRVTVIVADLNQDDATRMIYNKIRAAGIQVDVLVNNAGFGLGGSFVQNRPRLQDAMIHVNLQTPTRLCRMFLPGMLERGRGGILNIGSIGSFVSGPNNAVYCASKAFLLSLTEALADEVRGTPVRVTAVCPGALHTGFAERAGMEHTRLYNLSVMSASEAARCAYRAFIFHKTVSVVGAFNKVLLAAARVVPRCAATRVSGYLQQQDTV